MLCDSDILPMRFMHTDSSVMRLSDSLSSVNRIHESSKYLLRIVVFQQHYPDSLVNYTYEILTALSYYRITTRIGIYPKNPCQLSLRTIDLSFGIQNQYESVVTYPKELSTYPKEYLTAISNSESLTFVSVAKKSHPLTPSSGNMSHPSSGNYEPPTVEI